MQDNFITPKKAKLSSIFFFLVGLWELVMDVFRLLVGVSMSYYWALWLAIRRKMPRILIFKIFVFENIN